MGRRSAPTVAKGSDHGYWYGQVVQPCQGLRFIQPEDASKDVFVHISAVERAGLTTLKEGRKVSFELVSGRDGKTAAENLALAD